MPLGETEVHQIATLRLEAGSLLQRTAHGTGGNGQVAVVTGNPGERMVRYSGDRANVREASGLPSGSHFECGCGEVGGLV